MNNTPELPEDYNTDDAASFFLTPHVQPGQGFLPNLDDLVKSQPMDAALGDEPDEELKKKMVYPMPDRSAKTAPTVITKLALSEIYKDVIEKNLEKFKKKYNEKNPGSMISLALTLNKRIFDAKSGTGYIAQAAVAVEMRQFGLGRVLMNKVYNFRHIKEMDDEGEWKLTLYAEIMYELIGGCVTLAILMNPDNEQHGHKEQTQTSEQKDSGGNSLTNGGFQGGD